MKINIFWHRRDLRTDDNAALYHALKSGLPVLPLFVFDKNILEDLEDKSDARLSFIHFYLNRVKEDYEKNGSSIKVYYDTPKNAFVKLVSEFEIDTVFTNHDYEPYAKNRDSEIESFLNQHQIKFKTFKDQCIFEKSEVVKDDGLPYTVFTPYMNKWKSKMKSFYLKSYPTEKYFNNLFKTNGKLIIPSLADMGFQESKLAFPSEKPKIEVLKNYHEKRDIPSVEGTSRISVHLRFGTISIRKMAKLGYENNEKWLNELIWRDFYMMILWHFPHVQGKSFREKYDQIPWRNSEEDFNKWCEGKTGYPIVDAGMRELNETGFMHNRVRMVVASFLTKHLLIDWRWGEAYFAKKLLDFELSSNNGGWQWASGSGCDAAPYFRVFNPEAQTSKFDPQLKYIKKWVKEYDELSYIRPMVDHKMARERAIETYKKALS
jgi:deoxyribodipyrimidine photo-lyase